jgi:excisionase family DNA binding protein
MLKDRPTETESLLTTKQVRERLAISREYTYRLLQAGTIPSVRVGRLRRVRPSDLDRYIEARTQRASD